MRRADPLHLDDMAKETGTPKNGSAKAQDGSGAGLSLLRPDLVARLGALNLKARQVVEGVLSGLHKSPHHGQSIEFAEHKEYSPGDEIRHIDWKAYGKFDKYYVKQFEHETNLRAWIVLDASKSMAYGHEGVTKLEYAKVLAASLAYLLVQQSDAVGVLVYGAGTRTFLPVRASGGHLHEVLDTLEATEADGETNLPAAIDFLAERSHRRAMVLLLTDLLDPEEATVAHIRRLRARRHDVSVFHLMDRAEVEFPFEDPTLFLGMEDDRQLPVHPLEIRESYLEEVQAFLEATRKSLTEADIDYRHTLTDTPYDRVLVDFLGRRKRQARSVG
jgi:uncharacterized protein (DUF58 family)